MFIQSGYGVQAYSASSKIALQQSNDVTKAVPANLSKNSASANTTEQVTLSSAGKKLAASGNNATQPRTPAQERLIMAASSSRQSAEKIASDIAYAPSGIIYDISNTGGGEEVRTLATSGRIIDDEFKARFNSEAAAIDAQRRAIYESETAKGTDPLQILTMMIDFTNTQSKDYLEASGWGYQGSSPP
ncbi:hypothetical protein [Pseudothauera rhizosphaerae]|uniref:Uncharacterized protein n=1 Tax=Pseudothauera rhizosphaerae TaxID=2565932 RepID=A0A4S4AS46_9RHOO|nr:hypothetical protein [Pseudothauera rhizosphaerae]THF62693.1 hypothetical protein E6O51_06970 [Pseudothauera rhizosphaerae]